MREHATTWGLGSWAVDEREFELPYPDGEDLALDRAAEELVGRASRVFRTHLRLKGLFRSVEKVSAGIEIQSVLHRFVDAAAELVAADYAALQTASHDGHLGELILAKGHSVLHRWDDELDGQLVTSGALSAERSGALAGRRVRAEPPGFVSHSGRPCCLVVPVKLADVPFGTLYLCSGPDGPFGREDAELASALAALAGNLIRSALLYSEIEAREHWMSTSSRLSALLLTVEAADSLQLVAEELASDRADERITVVVPGRSALAVRVASVEGPGSHLLEGKTVPLARTRIGEVFDSGAPLNLDGGAPTQPSEPFALGDVHAVGPVLFLPLTRQRKVCAVLVIARPPGSPQIAASEERSARDFAERISLVLDLVASRDAHELALDRARIARDLHDHVIQILFGVGLDLKNARARLDDAHEDTLTRTIERVDEAIGRMRNIVFAISGPAGGSTRKAIIELAAEASKLLDQPVTLDLSGPLDTIISDDLRNDVTAVAREMLTNTVKHARATSVSMTVAALEEHVLLRVEDDGVGLTADVASGGLANMRRRALERGGSFETESIPGRTVMTWSVPAP